MDVTQIILIVFIVLLVIAYPILVSQRNKKEQQKLTEQTNSLKRGDKVLTSSGVYGTIVDLQLEGDRKIVTIETGTDKKKGYMSFDAYAIYTVFKEGEEPKADEKKEDKKSDKNEEKKSDKNEEKKDSKSAEVEAEVLKEINGEEKPAETPATEEKQPAKKRGRKSQKESAK